MFSYMKTTTSKNKVTICELHPFYNYTVIVQALPLEGYPSKKRNTTLHMPQDGIIYDAFFFSLKENIFKNV